MGCPAGSWKEERGVNLLTPQPAAQRAGNVAFEVADEQLWRECLEEAGVLTWVSDGRVRCSPHLYNDASDIRRGAEAAAKAMERAGALAPSSSSGR